MDNSIADVQKTLAEITAINAGLLITACRLARSDRPEDKRLANELTAFVAESTKKMEQILLSYK